MFLKEPIVCRRQIYEIKNAHIKTPVKVALTNDWHVSKIVSDKQYQMLKKELLGIKPDVIIVQGDSFDTPNSFDDAKLVAELKRRLRMCVKIAPTIMVLGNHDQIEPMHRAPESHADFARHIRNGVIEEWRRLCKECDVKLLLDEWFEVKNLRIFGMLQDPEMFYITPREKGENIPAMRRHIQELGHEGALKFKPRKVHWFATHAPIDNLYKMRELAGFDAFSFGHTHGGCVPILIDVIVDACGGHGGIVAPFLKWFPTRYMRGREKLKNGASYIVNTGMVMTQNSAPKLLHYINFLKSAEVTEVNILPK